MVEYLQKDPISHIDMLDPVRRGTGKVIYDGEDGVVIYETLSDIYMASMDDAGKCLAILEPYQATAFSIHQKETAERLKERFHFPEFHLCYQYVYAGNEFETEQLAWAEIEESALERVRVLGIEHLEEAARHYEAMDDPEYIRELISRKQLWGIFEDEKMAGFIGQHLEGSMGLLEVLPEYRKKGYGKILEAFLIRRFLGQGRIPFCQVFDGNDVSASLQRRLGMVCSPEPTWWLF